MTVFEVKSVYVGLTPEQQMRLLALLAHNLTVAARTAYPGQVSEHLVPQKLRGFNEILHTVTGQARQLIDGHAHRYPDDLFIDALFERAQQGNCEQDLTDAFAWSCAAACPPIGCNDDDAPIPLVADVRSAADAEAGAGSGIIRPG